MSEQRESSTDLVRSPAIRRLKVLLLGSSLATIALLVCAAYLENFTGDWRTYQKDYRAQLLARADTPDARRAALAMEIDFKQLYLTDLNRIDRCVTCHVGIDDPKQVNAPQPLRRHSGAFLIQHPIDKFGCTVCHDGQGRATTRDTAHGMVEHWPEPMLRGEDAYTTCGRCHYENDLFGAEYELFTEKNVRPPITKAELGWTLPGDYTADAHAVGRGKQLVLSHGCLGCHQYRHAGGEVGRDITHVGDKTAHDFDFTHVAGAHTVANWLYQHFKNPPAVTPGTLMPTMGFTDQQAHDLTEYMRSLHSKHMPASVTPVPDRRSDEPATAPQLFAMFCSACHGQEGAGSKYFDDRNTSVPALKFEAMRLSIFDPDQAKIVAKLLRQHADLQALKAKPPFDPDAYAEIVKQIQVMRDVIRKGRAGIKRSADSPLAPVNMPSWRQTFTDTQIDDILAYVIDLYPWQ